MDSRSLGREGEDAAGRYLEERGYVVLDRRYRFERAEIDLVCFQARRDGKPGGEIVFVEVKTRSGLSFGRPESGLSSDQRRSIAKAARAYLYERKLEGSLCRFDVVTVMLDRESGATRIEHFEHAFTA